MGSVVNKIDESKVITADEDIDMDEFDDNILSELHPQLVNVVRAIRAEKQGTESIAWSDFSQHNKS